MTPKETGILEQTTGPRLPKLRLFVADDLGGGAAIALGREQSHYLANVLHADAGDRVALFNGRDGEWQSEITSLGKRAVDLRVTGRLRPQAVEPDLWLAFAPIKRWRIDFVAAKATELGVARLIPVMTARTQMTRVNTGRLRANAVEAAEQCGRLTVPECRTPVPLDDVLADWPVARRILLCDESGGGTPIASALDTAAAPGPWAIVIGPEGGFNQDEFVALAALPGVVRVSLGPRILRAETAALAALACWQAWIGDWRGPA